jgi:ubiquinone/menaquinone biosynthesis C-methylase UbiE
MPPQIPAEQTVDEGPVKNMAGQKYGSQRGFKSKQVKVQNLVPKGLESVNLVEIGPGTGMMMCDILRTIKQFTGNLKNVHINLIDSSPNLIKV